MTIYVTPVCHHGPDDPDSPGFSGSGSPMVGKHVVVSADGVWLDGEQVIARDRRMKKARHHGHPWLTERYALFQQAWTGFRVQVEP